MDQIVVLLFPSFWPFELHPEKKLTDPRSLWGWGIQNETEVLCLGPCRQTTRRKHTVQAGTRARSLRSIGGFFLQIIEKKFESRGELESVNELLALVFPPEEEQIRARNGGVRWRVARMGVE